MNAHPFRVALAALSTALMCVAQPSAAQQKMIIQFDGKVQSAPDRPDEFKGLVNQVQEAYKAPFEVDKDIRDELKKQYQNPTPEREQKILREVRRLYVTTPEQEERIVRELRQAYNMQSPQQEEQLFAEIRRGGTLPPGTVPMAVQQNQAEKLFTRFDTNRDGMLSGDELPEALAANIAKWDANRDGVIEPREYWAYFQASLKTVSEKVASGEIAIKLPGGATIPKPAQPASDEEPRLQVFRAGKLPPGLPGWFTALDTDNDGQVGLYEWRTGGGNLDEFSAMDVNGDGLLTPEEYLNWKKEADAASAKQGMIPQRISSSGKPDPTVKVKPTGPGKAGESPPGRLEKFLEKKGGDVPTGKLEKLMERKGEAPPKEKSNKGG